MSTTTIPTLHVPYFISIRDQLERLPEISSEITNILLSAHAAVLSTFSEDIIISLYSVDMPDSQCINLASQIDKVGGLPQLIAINNDYITSSLLANNFGYHEFALLDTYLRHKLKQSESHLLYLNLWMGIGLFTITIGNALKSEIDHDVNSNNVVALTNIRAADVMLRNNILKVFSSMRLYLENTFTPINN